MDGNNEKKKMTKMVNSLVGYIVLLCASSFRLILLGQDWTKTGWTKIGWTKMNWTKSRSTLSCGSCLHLQTLGWRSLDLSLNRCPLMFGSRTIQFLKKYLEFLNKKLKSNVCIKFHQTKNTRINLKVYTIELSNLK